MFLGRSDVRVLCRAGSLAPVLLNSAPNLMIRMDIGRYDGLVIVICFLQEIWLAKMFVQEIVVGSLIPARFWLTTFVSNELLRDFG